MLIPSFVVWLSLRKTSLSRRVNANSQRFGRRERVAHKLIKKGEC